MFLGQGYYWNWYSKALVIDEKQTNWGHRRAELYCLRGPYTETIDLWVELFFANEIRRIIEWLRDIKTADQHCYNLF